VRQALTTPRRIAKLTEQDLRKLYEKLHARFHKGKHVNQSLWLREQLETIDDAFSEANFDFGKIADALAPN